MRLKAVKDPIRALQTSYGPCCFPAYKYSDTQKEADNAAGAFKTLVSDASSPPTIIVRIASKLGNGATRSLFAPFGILGAKGHLAPNLSLLCSRSPKTGLHPPSDA